ncbi:MAG TPA: ABC transporter substrate-binding protein [Stellaceae bacterium]|jgi:NitT/TauT family transport system substrate-binding protein|nr:ABC transporter substrate-binding protein [Stellaceae bacterium]
MRRSTLALSIIALLLAPVASRAEPPAIRLAWSVMPGELAPVIFVSHPELAPNNGKTYAFAPVHITASPQMIQGLAANEIDIAAFAFSSFPLAIQNAGMTDLRVIADESQDGVPGYYTDESKIRKDGGIAKVEDLKGKVLATTGFGAASDIALRAMLTRHGISPTKDVTIIQAAYANMPAILKEHKADLVTAIPPFAFDPDLTAMSTTLFTGKDAMGSTEKIFWAAKQDFLAANRAAVIDFMTDFMRAQRWFLDPANRQAALQIVTAFTKASLATYDYIWTTRDYFRDPRGMPNTAALQHSIDVQVELGILKAPLDVNAYTDLSLVKEAASRLDAPDHP